MGNARQEENWKKSAASRNDSRTLIAAAVGAAEPAAQAMAMAAEDEARAARAATERAEAEARRARAEVETMRERLGEAERVALLSQREGARVRAELSAVEGERAALLEKLRDADAARLQAQATADALRSQPSAQSGRGAVAGGGDGAAAGAAAVAAANELAKARSESSRAQQGLAAAEAQLSEAEREVGRLKGELEASNRERDEEGARISEMLIEAKLAAAQYEFERDEHKLKAKKLRGELDRVLGGGKQVAQHATKLEVKYEALKEKYDADMHELIETLLQLAEARAKLA
jgi:hypothetical protein